MWMFFYYTLWSFENVERKLQNMELAGWRLTNVYLYWFKFRFLYKGIIINHNKNRANLH